VPLKGTGQPACLYVHPLITARQQLGRNIIAATIKNTKIEEL
jgi:hypothetical protein